MKITYYFLLLVFSSTLLKAQNQPRQEYRMVDGSSYIQSKNVYLLTLFESLPEVRKILESDPELLSVANRKAAQLSTSLENCEGKPFCFSEKLPFTPDEVEEVAERLQELTRSNPALEKVVADHLIPSGMYQLQGASLPEVWLANAWKQDAKTINHIISVYVRGEKPNYPNIDSLGMKIPSSSYSANIHALNELVHVTTAESKLFFITPLSYAMNALAMARMERAGDFEPMRYTVNRGAYLQAMNTEWDDYPYPLILIPGAGTDNYLDNISAGGVLRCRLALKAYQDGLAPFIMVSGGNVHPYKVGYNEAIEMKRYLMELGVPESAILVDPHARHTTTNMRNAARIMFRYGFPMDRPSITVTTPAQSRYIYADTMQKRCVRELGYSPYRNGKRLSATTAEFYPLITALQIDADEPLDP